MSGRRTTGTEERHRVVTSGLILVALSASAYGAGMSWMTHLYHHALILLEPAQVERLEMAYAGLVEALLLPVGGLGLLSAVGLLALRPAGIPVILLLLSVALALPVLAVRPPGWEPWAELLHITGSLRLGTGELHPAYQLYMEIHWLRVLGSSLSVLVNLVIALLAMSGRRSGALAVAAPLGKLPGELKQAAVAAGALSPTPRGAGGSRPDAGSGRPGRGSRPALARSGGA